MANQHTKAGTPPQSKRILEFVRAHPECTTHDIRASLGYKIDRIGTCLMRMSHAGFVNAERVKGKRLNTWTAVDEDKIDHDRPIQITRQDWEPGCAPTDPWITALFGKPVKQSDTAKA